MAQWLLCVPCREAIKGQAGKVLPLPGRSDKITCKRCGRRRYGVLYEVSGSLPFGGDGGGSTGGRPVAVPTGKE